MVHEHTQGGHSKLNLKNSWPNTLDIIPLSLAGERKLFMAASKHPAELFKYSETTEYSYAA